jgi:[ribosomal protein S18]-alanine N-acetyltransferase
MAFSFHGAASVVYRLYEAGDFPALYAIEEASFEPPFRFSRGYLRELLATPQSATWVAEEEGRAAGFATVRLSMNERPSAAYIETIEVDREWRGRGVGGELLRRMEGSAQAAGATTLWLHVDAENNSAIRLYEAHGYVLQGREESFYPRGRTALIYAKPIVSARGISSAES